MLLVLKVYYVPTWMLDLSETSHEATQGSSPKNRSCTAGKLQILENWIMLLLCQKVLKNGLEYEIIISYYLKVQLSSNQGSVALKCKKILHFEV